MVFIPKVVKIETLNNWELNPNLPEVKYKVEGRLNLSALSQDIAKKLPVKKFRDRVEFDDVVGRAFAEVWPRWEDYFSPLVRKQFFRDVIRAVFDCSKIELADTKKA